MRVVREIEREDEERKRLIGPGTKASLILTVYGRAAGLESFGNVTPQTDSNRFSLFTNCTMRRNGANLDGIW